jgi:hypothetical protein
MKFPISAAPENIPATTLPIGKEYRIWDADIGTFF